MILTTYILLPLLGLLLILIGFLIAKKNNLLSNKKIVWLVIISLLILVLPSIIGWLDYAYMPWGYLALVAVYLLLGSYYPQVIQWVMKKPMGNLFDMGLVLILTLAGMGFFSLVFNLCNELQYGLWASTPILSFLFPTLFNQTYRLFLLIPPEVYKVWKYSSSTDLTGYEAIDYNRLKVYEVELFKMDQDIKPVNINAKAPEDMPFGIWFKRLISDYNRKSPLAPIDISFQSGECGWIFYIKPSLLQPRQYLDFEKTFLENRIAERSRIVAKRVKEKLISE